MTKLQEAIAEISSLPEASQETIAKELLLHLKKIGNLRTKLQKGMDSFERGEYAQLEMEELIKQARSMHDEQ